MTSPSRRDVERRLSDLEGDGDGDDDDGEDMSIQEAMWEALVDYHTR